MAMNINSIQQNVKETKKNPDLMYIRQLSCWERSVRKIQILIIHKILREIQFIWLFRCTILIVKKKAREKNKRTIVNKKSLMLKL